jgi:hypothetical protein
VSSALVAGALAAKPGNAGEAWVRLSWVLGLRDLGFDAWLVEEVESADSQARAWFEGVTDAFGLGGRRALLTSQGDVLCGPAPEDLRDVVAGAELLVNISGNLALHGLRDACRRRVYVDLDPGYTQLWHAGGHLGDLEASHDAFYTVGLAVGSPACPLPTAGIEWRGTLPPVLLGEWPALPPAGVEPLTTIGSWRGGYGRVEHEGHLFGQKAHEFRRLAGLPRRAGIACEAALELHPADDADAEALRAGGWRLVDPREAAGDPGAYRDYIGRSGAELSPAQGIYVETRCGWFSDRTAAYLASGRPAIVQETGIRDLPIGEGLLTFASPDDALAALERVAPSCESHALAARAFAEAHLDSRLVLTRLLEGVIE